MNKIKIIQDLANNLKIITANLEALAEVLDGTVSEEKTKDEQIMNTTVDKAIPKAELITLEQVRAVLAEKSQSGKQPEVKALILKFGANKLTDINPSCYEELLKEAEVL